MTTTLHDRPPIGKAGSDIGAQPDLEAQFKLEAATIREPAPTARLGSKVLETAISKAELPTDAGLPVETATTAWSALAACREIDNAGDLFFSEELHEIAAAKRICAECPVIAPCLEGAIRRREPWGVWGGQIFLNGRILAKKRRRGRPPKNPRPEDMIPEIPVPEHLVKLIA